MFAQGRAPITSWMRIEAPTFEQVGALASIFIAGMLPSPTRGLPGRPRTPVVAAILVDDVDRFWLAYDAAEAIDDIERPTVTIPRHARYFERWCLADPHDCNQNHLHGMNCPAMVIEFASTNMAGGDESGPHSTD